MINPYDHFQPAELARLQVQHYLEEQLVQSAGGARHSRPIQVTDAMLAAAKQAALSDEARNAWLEAGPAVTERVRVAAARLTREDLVAYLRETAAYARPGEKMARVDSADGFHNRLFLHVVPECDGLEVLSRVHEVGIRNRLYFRLQKWSYHTSLRKKDSMEAKLANACEGAVRGLRMLSVMLPYYLKGWRRIKRT